MTEDNRNFWVGKISAYFVALLICSILGLRTYQFERKDQTLPIHEYLIGVLLVSNCLSVQINIADIGKIVRTLMISDKQ
jgi:hypothetical protein